MYIKNIVYVFFLTLRNNESIMGVESEMIEMLMEQATEVRKQWSAVCDSVVHDKPKFIKRTRDRLWFSNLSVMEDILGAYQFTAERYVENDGTVTLSLIEIDIIENGKEESEARLLLGKAILEYAMEYYNEYDLYSHAPNRKSHVPYVFKALIMDDAYKIGECVLCRDGNS